MYTAITNENSNTIVWAHISAEFINNSAIFRTMNEPVGSDGIYPEKWSDKMTQGPTDHYHMEEL